MKDNISDFPGYYVTVDGKVYSRKNNRHGYLVELGNVLKSIEPV